MTVLSEDRLEELNDRHPTVQIREDDSSIVFASESASFRIDRDLYEGNPEIVGNLTHICEELNEIGMIAGAVTLNDIIHQDLPSSFETVLKQRNSSDQPL